MCGTAIGADAFSDLDYADDVALLAELLDLLHSTLEIFDLEAAPLGLSVNWKKPKSNHSATSGLISRTSLFMGTRLRRWRSLCTSVPRFPAPVAVPLRLVGALE